MYINYKKFNESLKNKLKGKSDSELINNLSNLSPQELLHLSTENNYMGGVIKSIENGANIDSYSIQYAVMNDNIEMTDYLYKNGFNLHDNDYFLLRWCMSHGYLEMMKYIISKGGKPETYNYEGLKLAIENDHVDIIKYFLDNNLITKNVIHNNLIRVAKMFDKKDIINLLKKYLNSSITNESLKTQKGSVIKRYKDVGKKMGSDLYFHKQYVNEYINPDFYNKLKSYLPKDVNFNIIKYNNKDRYISFINSPDFDTADEPIVSDAYKVTKDGKVTLTREKSIPQIYHHKWLFVKDDYKGFDVEESKERSRRWLEYSDQFNMSKIGSKKYWEEEAIPLFEGLKDKMKGKSENEIKREFDKLDIKEKLRKISRNKLPINFLPSDEEIESVLPFSNSPISPIQTLKRLEMINDYNLPDRFLPPFEYIQTLVKNTNDPPSLFMDFLKARYDKGAKEIIDKYFLTTEREDIRNEWMNFAMNWSLKFASPSMFEYTLENGADIDKLNDTKVMPVTSREKMNKLKEIYHKYLDKKEKEQMNESVWDKPEQEHTSAKTSVRQVPKPVKYLINNNELEPNTINLDIGGGRYENMTEFLSKFRIINYVYDPFNRSEQHNNMVLEKTKDGQSDSVTIFNVLNVIKEKENQLQVLEQAKNAIKEGGKVFIYSNYYIAGEQPKAIKNRDSFQQNYKLRDILPIVKEVFPNAYLDTKIKCVVATK